MPFFINGELCVHDIMHFFEAKQMCGTPHICMGKASSLQAKSSCLSRSHYMAVGHRCTAVMGLVWVLLLVSGFVCTSNAEVGPREGTLTIDGQTYVARTDENFICATLDWYPPEKCDYGYCSWGNASALRLDLKNPVLLNAVRALAPLKIRFGGTLQDALFYQTESEQKQPCNDFIKNSSTLFGFNEGCLPLARWDELNAFFKKTGALAIFGLNALRGKAILNKTAAGPWNSTNAASLIRYTVKKGYKVYAWELGNELSGRGAFVGIDADSYTADTIVLHEVIRDSYKGFTNKPYTMAPGGFFEHDWFRQYISKTRGVLDVITHHIYNLGPGSDENLIDKILNSSILDGGADVFRDLYNIVKASKSRVVAWVGEAGGVYNSGRNGVTNTFVFSFWYLDQLGQSSIYGTKTYCRQSLIGGNYGLLNTNSFAPNPDYYSALLWHQLMGRNVLLTNFTGTNKIRAYAHCAKRSQGVAILLMNIGNTSAVRVNVQFNSALPSCAREEYLLTPKDGSLQSQIVLLNERVLTVDSSGHIPALQPHIVNASVPVSVGPFSILFIHIPCVSIPACNPSAVDK